MKSKTHHNQSEILRILPELIKQATAAQTQLAAIAAHFEITQDGVLKSTLAPSNGTQRFTPQFEEYSDLLLLSVTEISDNLSHVTDTIEQIQEATKHLVVGVETQLKISPVASMREAVNSLESTLRTRPATSIPAVKY